MPRCHDVHRMCSSHKIICTSATTVYQARSLCGCPHWLDHSFRTVFMCDEYIVHSAGSIFGSFLMDIECSADAAFNFIHIGVSDVDGQNAGIYANWVIARGQNGPKIASLVASRQDTTQNTNSANGTRSREKNYIYLLQYFSILLVPFVTATQLQIDWARTVWRIICARWQWHASFINQRHFVCYVCAVDIINILCTLRFGEVAHVTAYDHRKI